MALSLEELRRQARVKAIQKDFERAVPVRNASESHLLNPNHGFSRYNISDVSDRQAADISGILGGNYEGYKNAINSNGIFHILKRHGPNGKADNSMRDMNDLARIGYVLENYDTVERALGENGDEVYSTEFRTKDDRPAPMLKYSKKVNGTYYVVEAIPESNHKKLWIVSAYMTKADGGTQASDALNPGATPIASLASDPSALNLNIGQGERYVNMGIAESADPLAQAVVGLVGDMGAKTSDFVHEVKESQSRTTPAYYEDNNVPEEARSQNLYTAVTEAESTHNARLRLDTDYDGEVAEMIRKPSWTNEEMDMGFMVLDDLRAEAEKTGDWSKFRDWDKVVQQHKEEAGRSLQALAKQNRNSAASIVSNAAQSLENAKSGTDTNAVMATVNDYANRFETAAKDGNIDELVTIIKDTAKTRKTGSLIGNKLSKIMLSAIDRIASRAKQEAASAPETREAMPYTKFLQDFAKTGIESIALDHNKTDVGGAVNTIRRLSMLSKPATVLRNLVANNVFDPLDALANNISLPLDVLLSKVTGTRSVAFDRSWASKAKRQGSLDGLAMAIMSVGLDVSPDGNTGRYETGGGRTFKMAKDNFVLKLLSAWEKYMGCQRQCGHGVVSGYSGLLPFQGIQRSEGCRRK